MRKVLSFDEIIEIIKKDNDQEFEKKRFAISALAARIHEELVVWQRIQGYLEMINSEGALPEGELKTYMMLSKHSESLTYLIIKSARELEIEDGKSFKELLERLNNNMLGDDNDKKDIKE